MNLQIILFVLFACGSRVSRVYAFPEMVRHGYVHCTSCHTTLTGGGLLNEYGRSLSKELLSQLTFRGGAAPEGDEKFLYGTVQPPNWLLLGGDIRLLQAFVETKEVSRGRFLIMQTDLDASAQVNDRLRVFASMGRVEPRESDKTAKDFIMSPRHGIEFILNKPDAESRWTLRLGRFMPSYGINFAEHMFATRRLLDFSPGQERYASELSWVSDQISMVATQIFSQNYYDEKKYERGSVFQVATVLGENSKIGANIYSTEREEGDEQYSRRVLGIYAHFALDKKWYALAEVDRPQGRDRKWGFIELFKLGYEIHQGLHFFGIQEFTRLDTEHSAPQAVAYSLGSQWFPRPHWDILGIYRRERDQTISADFQDVVWLVGHFYL